jgi:hypothetical protein
VNAVQVELGYSQAMTEVERERHMERIWLKALNDKVQKKALVQKKKKALVQKRSAICTVMQNKFAGKYSPIPDTLRKVKIPTKCVSPKDLCKLCVENRCVLVSIESVKRRSEDPKAYCVFYMYFYYTAAIVEVRWKECLSKEEGRIGNNTTEAFAMLVLVNNYKAWLYCVLKKALISSSNEAEAEEDQFVQKERAKQKRKLVTRELREFTEVPSEGERKTKGWSDEGMIAYEMWLEAIVKDVKEDKYVAWERAYCGVMERLGHYRKDIEESLQQARYKPNLGVACLGGLVEI